ncbi:MAG TPA: nuclear transport factor 2 family protein [Rectinemataceae bacterium]|nr:nuclear transport factor 2 family protein [Rectinemataceae bacterium]
MILEIEAEAVGSEGKALPLDLEEVRALWSKTYNRTGKPDWSHIFPYYRPDIVFEDSIQRIEGLDEFIGLCKRLTMRCETLEMEITSIARAGDHIHFQWTMTMSFKKFPSTPIYGATVLTIHEDGRIGRQRDYYDLWGDIFNGIPWFKKPYRRFMRKKFG